MGENVVLGNCASAHRPNVCLGGNRQGGVCRVGKVALPWPQQPKDLQPFN